MITSAACRATINGTLMVIPVHHHCDFFEIMKLLHCNYNKNEVEQGFIAYDPITRKKEFVNRIDAYLHARECNQIKYDPKIQPLYSEDLY